MRYQCQVRTILQSGAWSEWTNIADPMTKKDKDYFMSLREQFTRYIFGQIPAEFRFIEVKDDSPSVFGRRQAD